MKYDIFFLCQFFYPEHNSSATLPFDTAKHFAQSGYSVGVLCGYPKEYTNDEDIPICEEIDGVHIHRVKYIQLGRRRKLSRLINYFSFTLALLLRLFEIKNYKVVIVYSNPPVLPIATILAKKLFKTKIIFVSYDVYPEVAYASNTLNEQSFISRVMRLINRWLFKLVDAVVALTDEMRDFILRHRQGITADKVITIPNWAHESVCCDQKKAREKFGFSNEDFVVSYFGNLGICQDETALLSAMSLLKDRKNIKFFVAGHGSKLQSVAAFAKDLPNVKVCNFLTDSEFEQAIAASSCGVISLQTGLIGTCAPSKYYSYLQGGLPVLAVAEESSYLAKDVLQHQIGCWTPVGDGAALANAIVTMQDSPAQMKEMAERADGLYKKCYSMQLAMEKYSDLLNDVLSS